MNIKENRLSPIDLVDNRRILMIENALAQNNFIDCDYIQHCADKLRDAENKEEIENAGEELIGGIKFHGGRTLRLKMLLQEIKDISLS